MKFKSAQHLAQLVVLFLFFGSEALFADFFALVVEVADTREAFVGDAVEERRDEADREQHGDGDREQNADRGEYAVGLFGERSVGACRFDVVRRAERPANHAGAERGRDRAHEGHDAGHIGGGAIAEFEFGDVDGVRKDEPRHRLRAGEAEAHDHRKDGDEDGVPFGLIARQQDRADDVERQSRAERGLLGELRLDDIGDEDADRRADHHRTDDHDRAHIDLHKAEVYDDSARSAADIVGVVDRERADHVEREERGDIHQQVPNVRLDGEAAEEVLEVEFFLFVEIERRAFLDEETRDDERHRKDQTEAEHDDEVEVQVRHVARGHFRPQQRRREIEDAGSDDVEEQLVGVGAVALLVVHRDVRTHRHVRHLRQRRDGSVDDVGKDHPHHFGRRAKAVDRGEQKRQSERDQRAADDHVRLASAQFGPTGVVGDDAHRRVDDRVPDL